MKIFLVLFTLSIIIFGCSDYKSEIQRENIVGEWKEIQGRKTKNSPIEDIVVNCEDSLSNAGVFFFNPDGTYLQKGICPDRQSEEKGTWEYRDSIISLTIGKDNIKFSVSDAGENKIKLSSFSISTNGGHVYEDSDFGFFVVLEKQ